MSAFGLLASVVFLAFIAVIFVFVIWMNVRILNKAGHSGWWCLLMFVPLINIIMIWVFAWTSWPAVDEGDVSAVFD